MSACGVSTPRHATPFVGPCDRPAHTPLHAHRHPTPHTHCAQRHSNPHTHCAQRHSTPHTHCAHRHCTARKHFTHRHCTQALHRTHRTSTRPVLAPTRAPPVPASTCPHAHLLSADGPHQRLHQRGLPACTHRSNAQGTTTTTIITTTNAHHIPRRVWTLHYTAHVFECVCAGCRLRRPTCTPHCYATTRRRPLGMVCT